MYALGCRRALNESPARILATLRAALGSPSLLVIESYSLAQCRLGLVQATSFLRHLLRTTVLLTPTEEDHRGAIRCVLRYPDQDISLADAILAEVSDRLAAPVWTYDHHFDVMGARVWRP